MVKTMKLKVIVLFAIAAVILGYSVLSKIEAIALKATADAQIKAIKAQEEADLKLGQYTLNIMNLVRSPLSPLRRQIVARNVVTVTNSIFTSDEHRKAFIAVLAIESRFDRLAQSPTGPRGISQTAKAAFNEGIKYCSEFKYDDGDVWETEIGLLAGACYFRMILENTGNDVFAAIVAYNQGLNSDSFKSFSRSGDVQNTEALRYVTKFVFLMKKTPKKTNEAIISATPEVAAKDKK